jgi:hypothetical protein
MNREVYACVAELHVAHEYLVEKRRKIGVVQANFVAGRIERAGFENLNRALSGVSA